jgi:hypothetical protein
MAEGQHQQQNRQANAAGERKMKERDKVISREDFVKGTNKRNETQIPYQC